MANLGSFAGGLSEGLNAGYGMALKKRQQDNDKEYSDKVIALKQNEDTRQQADANYTAKARAREDDWQTKNDALDAEYKDVLGGFQPAPAAATPNTPQGGNLGAAASVGTTGAVPDQPAPTGNLGATQTPPAAASGSAPGDNNAFNARALAYGSKKAALHMAKTGDTEHMAAWNTYMKKNGDDENLRLYRKAITGDADALAAVIKQHGGDPLKAKVDLGGGTIDLGNGKPAEDLGMFLRLGGASVLADEIDANKKSKQGDQKFVQETAKADSGLKNDIAERGLKGAQSRHADASAAAEKTRATFQTAQTGALQDDREIRAVTALVTKPLVKETDLRDPDGKTVWAAPSAFVMSRVAGAEPKTRAKAGKQALDDLMTIRSATRKRVSELLGNPATAAQVRQNFNLKDGDPDALVIQAAIEAALLKNQ